MRIDENTIINFLTKRIKDMNIMEYLAQDNLKGFIEFVKQNKDIAAAEEYQKITNASLDECRMVTSLAHKLL